MRILQISHHVISYHSISFNLNKLSSSSLILSSDMGFTAPFSAILATGALAAPLRRAAQTMLIMSPMPLSKAST